MHNLEKILQHGKELVRLTEEEIKEKQGMHEHSPFHKHTKDADWVFSPIEHKVTKSSPFAICTAAVGRSDKGKYERCVQHVKQQVGMKENGDHDAAIHIMLAEEFRPSETRKKMWIEMMHEMEMQNKEKGISCSHADYRGSPKDNESVDIGPGHTFHTHSCGKLPSDPDINTTKGLEKKFLCIGFSPEKRVYCYDINDPKGKPAHVF